MPKRSTRGAHAILVLVLLLAVVQAASLVCRARGAGTDFNVFYRSACALRQGAGPAFYLERDGATGWYRCIPPAGMVLLAWMPCFSISQAAVLWALVNLCLLAAALPLSVRVSAMLARDGPQLARARLWVFAAFVALASASLQVGQFSILFVVCWLAYLAAAARGRDSWAGFWLAVPAAVKLYPLLLVAVPLTLGAKRQVGWMAVSLVLLCGVLPAAVYRGRASGLSTSFVRGNILAPDGKAMNTLDAGPSANTGVDILLQRYLTDVPALHGRMPWFPHAHLPRAGVLLGVQLLRLLVLLVSLRATMHLRRRATEAPGHAAVMLMACWSATMYLMMPETKARYAVYLFPALLVLIVEAARGRLAEQRTCSPSQVGLILLCLVLALQLVPEAARALGVPLIGSVVLWLCMLRRCEGIGAAEERPVFDR